MERSFWAKLKSRKLWLALIGAASDVAIAWGVDATVVETVAGAAVALVSVVAYIVTEGKVDAASVDLGADLAKQVLNAIEVIKETKPIVTDGENQIVDES